MAYIIEEKCILCGLCLNVCEIRSILGENDNSIDKFHYHIDPDECVDCGECVDICPAYAIKPGFCETTANSI